MANTKEVCIEAVVPFDWASQLTADEAKMWAAWTLGPHDLNVRHERASAIPSESGGILSRYTLHVDGIAAMWEDALAVMVRSLRRQPGTEIKTAEYRDLDDPSDFEDDLSGWFGIRTPEAVEASRAKAAEHMNELVKGMHWVTTEIAPGVTRATLVPDES